MKLLSDEAIKNPANHYVIKYLNSLSKGPGIVHPDVQIRMSELGNNLIGMSVRKFKNSIVIVENSGSSIVAAAFGTAYLIKAGGMIENAIKAGASTVQKWTNGGELNLDESFDHEWVFGSWHNEEETWVKNGNA
jgi:hypothetical protein